MLKVSEIVDYCLSKKCAYMDFPFGETPICIKIFGKIFAEIYPKIENYKITLKCEPELAEFLRVKYQDIVIPGYHVPIKQKKYKNTVYLDKGIPQEEIFKMIDHSYEEVVKKLKKAEKLQIELSE